MNSFEKSEQAESPELDKVGLLKEIEESGKFLFHGSPKDLEVLNPNLAKDVSGRDFNNTESVYATSSVARAAVSAVFPNRSSLERAESWGTYADREGTLTVRCGQSVLDKAGSGFVYVLGSRDSAELDPELGSSQFKFNESQRPMLTVGISLEDLKNMGVKIEVTED